MVTAKADYKSPAAPWLARRSILNNVLQILSIGIRYQLTILIDSRVTCVLELRDVRNRQMIDNREQLPAQRTQDRQRHCPVCAAVPRLAQTMLDSRKGETVRLLLCQCGERVWDD
jgi:hypothetical protein